MIHIVQLIHHSHCIGKKERKVRSLDDDDGRYHAQQGNTYRQNQNPDGLSRGMIEHTRTAGLVNYTGMFIDGEVLWAVRVLCVSTKFSTYGHPAQHIPMM